MPPFSSSYSRVPHTPDSPSTPQLTSAGQNSRTVHSALLDNRPLLSPFSQQDRTPDVQHLVLDEFVDQSNIGDPLTVSTKSRSMIAPERISRHQSGGKVTELESWLTGTASAEGAGPSVDSLANKFSVLSTLPVNDPSQEAEKMHGYVSGLNQHNILRCPDLLPLAMDGSPSPIEPLPPPLVLPCAPIAALNGQRGNRNIGTSDSHPTRLRASETIIGLGVGPASLRMPKEISLLSKTVVASAATPKVHSPLAPQHPQLRSSPYRVDGGPSMQSPLLKASPSGRFAFRPIPIEKSQLSPVTEPLLVHACSRSAQGYTTSPSRPSSSSPDLKHLFGKTAKKISRSIRAPENTPPTPKSPQVVDKVTTSPLTISTNLNQLDTTHESIQGSSGKVPSTRIKEPFAGSFPENDSQPFLQPTILHDASTHSQTPSTPPLFAPIPRYSHLAVQRSHFLDYPIGRVQDHQFLPPSEMLMTRVDRVPYNPYFSIATVDTYE